MKNLGALYNVEQKDRYQFDIEQKDRYQFDSRVDLLPEYSVTHWVAKARKMKTVYYLGWGHLADAKSPPFVMVGH